MNKKKDVDLDLSVQTEPEPEFVVPEYAPGIKTVIRTVAANADHQNGVQAVQEVDAYLSQFRAEGWDLRNAHATGNDMVNGQPVIYMVYVLVR